MTAVIVVLVIAGGMITAYLIDRHITEKKFTRMIENQFGQEPPELESFDLDSIKAYWEEHSKNATGKLHVDEMTWADLDMDRVFARVNACMSSAGEETLYKTLHEPQFDMNWMDKLEAFLTGMQERPDLRVRLQKTYARLGKPRYHNLPLLLYRTEFHKLRHVWIYPVLACIPLLCIALMFFNLPVGVALLVMSGVANGVVFYFSTKKIQQTLDALRYLSSVFWCAKKVLGENDKDIDAFAPRLKEYYALLSGLIGKQSGLAARRIQDVDMLTIYFKVLFFTDIIRYNRIIPKIIQYSEELRDLYECVGRIDAAISVLSFRKSLDVFARPSFSEETELRFDGLYHPLLGQPVANSLTAGKSCIITGSNASGKSTFIKAVAVNCVLAQTIHTCTAETFHSRFAYPMTSMAVSDSILSGESYFIAEIKSLKRIVDFINGDIPCYCFIDEILKGTNTVERIAASVAVLRYFEGKNIFCMIASHDLELAEILKTEYENYHFREHFEQDEIRFDYKIYPGPSRTKNAIKLLGNMGFDESIVHSANAYVKTQQK